MNSALFRLLTSVALVASFAGASLLAQSPETKFRPNTIGPGDVLRLRIWREPDMSGDYSVDEKGLVTLPRVGQIDVVSIPGDSLQSVLTERYRVYLNNPSIELTLLRRVSITGAVKVPGVYPLDPTLTITDAIALAGGPAADGKRDRVEIRRAGKIIPADLRSDMPIAASPIQSGDQLYVPYKTWLARNTWLVSAAATITAVVLQAALRP